MSTPLSLRLCCLLTMAPALTDPASKSFSKLPSKLRPPDIQTSLTDAENRQLLEDIGSGTKNWNKKLSESKNLKDLNSKLGHILNSIYIQKENIDKKCVKKMNQPSNGVNGYSENGREGEESVLNVSAKFASLKGCETPTKETLVEDFQKSELKQTTDSEMVASDHNVETIDIVGNGDFKMAREEETEVTKTEEELSSEVGQKQTSLERRNQQLIRRLRRLQARQLEMHCRNQMGSYVSFQRKNLQTVANKSIGTQSISGTQSELKAELLKPEDVKNLSTSALVNLVRKIQASHASMNRRMTSHVKSRDEKDSLNMTSVLNIDSDVSVESLRVAGHLKTNMHHMQNAFDSDATESSSGGESCDEYDDYEQERKVPPPPLHRRAEWKWSTDRAAVASRWTWLQAQVSDLEYRIRQQSEIFKQIRHAKGSVILGDPPSLEEIGARLRQARANGQKLSPFETKIADIDLKAESNGSPCNISSLLLNVNQQASKLTQSLGNCLTPEQSSSSDKLKSNNGKTLNGVISGHSATESASSGPSTSGAAVGPSGDNSQTTPELSPSFPFLDATCMAARCRPVRSYRKRKLLRTAGLHQISRKAARLSTVKCHCNPPESSCPMCGGRYNNTQALDPIVMSMPEKVAVLDPSYHPVLSFKGEIPLPLHFESLLKSGEWQNKPPPKSAKVLAAEKRRQKLLANSMKERVRKNTKYGKRTANALLASAKLRNKYERTPPKSFSLKSPKKKVSDGTLCRPDLKRRRDALKYGLAALKQNGTDDNLCLSLQDSLTSGSRTPTPSPQMKDGLLSSSCPSSTLKEMRRRREDAYDIDNIVIPYSMAASTRVEKLQYKEIVTPKWREVTAEATTEENTENQPSSESTEDTETEDISEEAFIERHKICEAQERKRFTSFIHYPSRRSRGSRNEAGPSTPDSTLDPNKDDSSSQSSEDVARKRSSTLSSTSIQTSQFPSTPSPDDAFRRRASSTSVRRISTSNSYDDSSDFFFEGFAREIVEPWPERQFPLSEMDYEEMKRVLPPVEVKESCSDRFRVTQTKSLPFDEIGNEMTEDDLYVEDRTSSPAHSVSSGSNATEDPDDPEWTVVSAEVSRTTQKVRR